MSLQASLSRREAMWHASKLVSPTMKSSGNILALRMPPCLPLTNIAGDRVALECGIPCSKATCDACRTGQYNACPEIVFYSSPPVHGTLRRYHVHPEAWLHLLPDSITYEEGALLEPLSVALAGVDRSGLRFGDPLVICGAGPIGMVSLLAAHAAGAAPIVITDLDENRLAMAKSLVPRVRTVLVQPRQDAKANAEQFKQALGQEAKLVLECTGVESSIHAGIYVRSTPTVLPRVLC